MACRISPVALMPAAVSSATAESSVVLASSDVSTCIRPPRPIDSASRTCTTQTSPPDSFARSRAAASTRGEISEWSTATSNRSYIVLLLLLRVIALLGDDRYGAVRVVQDGMRHG